MCVRAVCVSRTPEITYRKGLQAASSQRTERIKCNGGKKNRTKIRFQVFFVCGDIKYIKKLRLSYLARCMPAVYAQFVYIRCRTVLGRGSFADICILPEVILPKVLRISTAQMFDNNIS